MERLDCDRMFVAVLEAGSFAAAAARLGTSSGQSSKMVSRLEAELGVQLVKRTTRALSPTEVGQAYYQRIKVLLDEFGALDASVRNAAGAPSGRLRLSSPITFGARRLAPVLMDFARQYPAIGLDVDFSDRLVNLVDEGFDIALRIGRLTDSSLIARKLCDMRIVLAAAPGYLQQRGMPASARDLAGHDCILDTNFRDAFNWQFQPPGGGEQLSVSISGRLHFSNAEACLTAAIAGLGITRIPSFIAGDGFKQGLIVPVLPQMEVAPLALYAVYPPARYLANKVRALVDFLAQRYRGQPEWDRDWSSN